MDDEMYKEENNIKLRKIIKNTPISDEVDILNELFPIIEFYPNPIYQVELQKLSETIISIANENINFDFYPYFSEVLYEPIFSILQNEENKLIQKAFSFLLRSFFRSMETDKISDFIAVYGDTFADNLIPILLQSEQNMVLANILSVYIEIYLKQDSHLEIEYSYVIDFLKRFDDYKRFEFINLDILIQRAILFISLYVKYENIDEIDDLFHIFYENFHRFMLGTDLIPIIEVSCHCIANFYKYYEIDPQFFINHQEFKDISL